MAIGTLPEIILSEDMTRQLSTRIGAGIVLAASIASLATGMFGHGISLRSYRLDEFLVGFGLFSFVFYFGYHKPNMDAHRKLLAKDGDLYRKRLDQALSEKGLLNMVVTRWFAGQLGA